MGAKRNAKAATKNADARGIPTGTGFASCGWDDAALRRVQPKMAMHGPACLCRTQKAVSKFLEAGLTLLGRSQLRVARTVFGRIEHGPLHVVAARMGKPDVRTLEIPLPVHYCPTSREVITGFLGNLTSPIARGVCCPEDCDVEVADVRSCSPDWHMQADAS